MFLSESLQIEEVLSLVLEKFLSSGVMIL